MKKVLFWIMVFVLAESMPVSALDSLTMPFGAMYARLYNDSAAGVLANEMCFNLMLEYCPMDSGQIALLNSHGIQSVRGGLPCGSAPVEAPMSYSWSNYAEINVSFPYPNDEVRMVPFGGDTITDTSMWISHRNNINTLSGISTYESRFNDGKFKNHVIFAGRYFFGFPGQERVIYQTDLYMKIDSLPGDSVTDVVAYVYWRYSTSWNGLMDTMRIATITAGDVGYGDSIKKVEIENIQFPSDSSYYLTVDIISTGERELAVDRVVISDQFGRDLIEDHDMDIQIQDKFQEFADSGLIERALLGWNLMDEPHYSNLKPFAYIYNLMHSDSVITDWMPIVYFDKYKEINGSYLSIVGTPMVLNDLYPFVSGNPYAGPIFQSITYNESGSLSKLNDWLSQCRYRVDSINEKHGQEQEFWLGPQAFVSVRDGKRYPTASELSCMTYMGLTWGCRGIVYWYYDHDTWVDYSGIITSDAAHDTTPLYRQIKNMIGPYIRAVDETYMPLVWDTSVVYQTGVSAPIEYISSIDTVSGSGINNPDAGWFQVGLFKDSDSTNYFMIVNRACSQDVDDPTEAPPITAVVNYDPDVMGSNYVYTIDVAKSINKYSSGGLMHWDPIPENTYSALMDQTIPFTVTLKAGEGRLFKVIPAPNLTDLSDGIDSSLVYEGKLGITKNTTVQNYQKLRLRGPSIIYIESNKKITLNKYSKLLAEGHAGNEIVFSPPQNSSWLGITMDTSATIDLRYCLIDSAGSPIYAKAHNTIELNNCSIILCDDAIVAHGNPSAIKIDSCTFRESKSTGITAIEPDTFIISQSLLQNDDYVGLYGIYVENALDKVEFYWTKVSHFFDYGIKYIGGNSTEDPVFFGDSLFGQGNGYSSAGLYVAKKGEEDRVRPMINELYSEYFNSGIELVGTDCHGSD